MTIADHLRALLRKHRDGLCIPRMVEELKGPRSQLIYATLNRMPDAWVERWEYQPKSGRPKAIWRVIPPNCPPPKKKS